jgi:hypothetical protein
LVGNRERVANPFVANNANETTFTNWQDLNSIWVTINPQTGQITTEPVALSTAASAAACIVDARQLAKQAQGMGGR